IGGAAVTADQEGDAISGTPAIPPGGSETVTVAQRLPGESLIDHPLVLTYRVTDVAGRLVDVYLPAVADMDPVYLSTHGSQPVDPHWSYAYDAAGNETVQVSPNEQPAYQQWVGNDSGITIVGNKTYYTPFAGGTTFSYDQYGRQVSQTLPDSS